MKALIQWGVTGLLSMALAGCGGGGGSIDAAPSRSTTGTMVKTSATSITVNRTRFDISGAQVHVNDNAATAADLRTGMRVRVKSSGDGSSARASSIEAEDEVRGAVTAVSASTMPQSFNIGNVKVLVDANTVYDDLMPATLDAIRVGVIVEVDGMRNAAGDILATRVEGKAARDPNGGGSEADELRGTVAAVGMDSITIGTTIVTISATTVFAPAPQCSLPNLKVGSAVEAHGAFTAAGSFAATRIECEDLEEDDTRAEHGGAVEIEGLVANLDRMAKTFTVNGQAVTYSDTTRFEDGTIDSLVADVRVEVKGTANGTTLVADEIEFESGH